MDHREYIERYLSADVDGELSAEERAAVDAHLAACEACRQRRAAELELKRLMRARLSIAPAPADVRRRVIDALASLDDRPPAALRRSFRRPLASIGIGLAGAIAAALAIFILTRPPANPEFDAAIANYLKAERQFTPNVPSATVDDMAVAMAAEFGFPFIWDFSTIGLNLIGARVDHTEDQTPIAQAFYKGPSGTLLCIMRRENATLTFPAGGEVIRGVQVYRYRGYSIAETQYNTVVCVMVTRLTADQLRPALNQVQARG